MSWTAIRKHKGKVWYYYTVNETKIVFFYSTREDFHQLIKLRLIRQNNTWCVQNKLSDNHPIHAIKISDFLLRIDRTDIRTDCMNAWSKEASTIIADLANYHKKMANLGSAGFMSEDAVCLQHITGLIAQNNNITHIDFFNLINSLHQNKECDGVYHVLFTGVWKYTSNTYSVTGKTLYSLMRKVLLRSGNKLSRVYKVIPYIDGSQIPTVQPRR